MFIINLNFYASVSKKVGRGILLRSLALIKNYINLDTTGSKQPVIGKLLQIVKVNVAVSV